MSCFSKTRDEYWSCFDLNCFLSDDEEVNTREEYKKRFLDAKSGKCIYAHKCKIFQRHLKNSSQPQQLVLGF